MEGLVEFNITFFIQIINVLVLFAGLTYLLFKPVSKFMAERSDGIKEIYLEAKNKETEVNELRKKFEKELAEIDALMAEKKREAEAERKLIINNAKEEAHGIKVQAKADMDVEKEKVMANLQDDIASLVMYVAAEILEREVDGTKDQEKLQLFIEEAKSVRFNN